MVFVSIFRTCVSLLIGSTCICYISNQYQCNCISCRLFGGGGGGSDSGVVVVVSFHAVFRRSDCIHPNGSDTHIVSLFTLTCSTFGKTTTPFHSLAKFSSKCCKRGESAWMCEVCIRVLVLVQYYCILPSTLTLAAHFHCCMVIFGAKENDNEQKLIKNFTFIHCYTTLVCSVSCAHLELIRSVY